MYWQAVQAERKKELLEGGDDLWMVEGNGSRDMWGENPPDKFQDVCEGDRPPFFLCGSPSSPFSGEVSALPTGKICWTH